MSGVTAVMIIGTGPRAIGARRRRPASVGGWSVRRGRARRTGARAARSRRSSSSTVVQRPSRTTTRPSTRTSRTVRPWAAQISCCTGLPRGRHCGAVRVVDHEVGGLAALERADAVGHAGRRGAADRRHLQPVVRAAARRVDRGVLGDADGEAGGVEDVDAVVGVRRVATEPDGDAGAVHRHVLALAEHALAVVEVGPRAVGDRGAACVRTSSTSSSSSQTAWASSRCGPSTPRSVEVHERAHAGPGEVRLRVVAGRRDVHRHVRAAVAGEVGGAAEQLVGRQIVADERDPALDQATGRQRGRASPPGGRASPPSAR